MHYHVSFDKDNYVVASAANEEEAIAFASATLEDVGIKITKENAKVKTVEYISIQRLSELIAEKKIMTVEQLTNFIKTDERTKYQYGVLPETYVKDGDHEEIKVRDFCDQRSISKDYVISFKLERK